MFVGLLKCPKSRLESERHPRVPWPRYSKKVDFSACWAPPIFMLARNLDSRPQSRACQREWICGQDFLTQRWVGKSIRSFAGDRLNFQKLVSASAGFGGCVGNFLEIHGWPNLCYSVWWRVLTCSIEFNACHDKSMCSFWRVLCLLMMGSGWVWPLGEGSNFLLVRGPQNRALGHLQADEQFDRNFCRKLSCRTLKCHNMYSTWQVCTQHEI